MAQCIQCGALLEVPSSGNVVTCLVCWKTNLVTREGDPVHSDEPEVRTCGGCNRVLADLESGEFFCPSCHRFAHATCWDSEGTICRRCSRERVDARQRADERWEGWRRGWRAFSGGVSVVLSWVTRILRQLTLIGAAALLVMFSGPALRKLVLHPGFDRSWFEAYLTWAPALVFAVGYILAMEADLVFQDWCGRLEKASQSTAHVALILWHRLTAFVGRTVSIGVGAVLGVGGVFLASPHLDRDLAPAAPFLGLLVFVAVGLTSFVRLIYLSSLVGAVVLSAYGVGQLGRGPLLTLKTPVFDRVVTPSDAITAGLLLATVSAYLLYASVIIARRYGFCKQCSAYVERRSGTCPRCGRNPDRAESRRS